MNEKPMKVVLLEPEKIAKTVEIDGSLAGMQNVVGGYIEAIYPFEDPNVCLICNEEGKLMGLPLNRALYDEDHTRVLDILAGPCIICDCSGDDFGSLPEEKAAHYEELFRLPEQFFKDFTGQIIAIPFVPEETDRKQSLSNQIQSAQTRQDGAVHPHTAPEKAALDR